MKTNFRDKKGAIEMSMTTIVTIVLVVVTLVLALVLIRSIFTTSTGAIEQVDTAIQDQINKLFASEGKNLAVYPASRSVTIKKGEVPKGFAFSVKNPSTEAASFTYSLIATDVTNCGSTFSKENADALVLGGIGSFNLGPSAQLDLPILIKFSVPESTPSCTVIYALDIQGLATGGANIFVTLE